MLKDDRYRTAAQAAALAEAEKFFQKLKKPAAEAVPADKPRRRRVIVRKAC